MRIITIPNYGIGASSEVHIAADTVMSFYYINYNGNRGTEIKLSDGSTVRTSMDDYEFKKLLENE